jgi:hypothetical protein
MAAPAITSVLDAIVARLEAITPTEDPGRAFRRSGETAPATTKAARFFDIDFAGQPSDESAAGRGVQTPGFADVLAAFRITVEYPLGRQAKRLDTVLASDSEHIRRALSRSANWTGTSVRTMRSFRSTVDQAVTQTDEGLEPGNKLLVVEVTFLYRETET